MNFDGEWVKELTIDDVPKAFRPIVEAIGIEAAANLANAYPGMSIYVPKPETMFERKRNEMICRDVRTLGYRDTARKYRLSEQWIRQLTDHDAGRKNEIDDRQIDMFENRGGMERDDFSSVIHPYGVAGKGGGLK